MCTDGIPMLYGLPGWLESDMFSAAFPYFLRLDPAYLPGYIIAVLITAALASAALLLVFRRKSGKTNSQLRYYISLNKAFSDANENLEYLKDESLRYVKVNKAVLDFYGMKGEDEIIGKDDFEISEYEFARRRRDTDMEALEKRRTLKDEVVWKDRVYQTTKFPVLLQGGRYGIGAYVEDVTEERSRREMLEKELQCSSMLLEMDEKGFSEARELYSFALSKGIELSDSSGGCVYRCESGRLSLAATRTEGEDAALPDSLGLDESGIFGRILGGSGAFFENGPEDGEVLFSRIKTGRYIAIPAVIDRYIKAVAVLWGKGKDYTVQDVSRLSVLVSGVMSAASRKEAQEKLAYEREKYLNTLISIGDGVMVVDKNGDIEMLNGVAQLLTGWTDEEASGRNYKEVFRLSHEVEGMEINDPIAGAISTGKVQELGNHAILTSRGGARFYLEDSAAPIRDGVGGVSGVVLVFRDVTEKKEQRRKIEYLSYHDSLTGLYNRRFFEAELLRYDAGGSCPITIVMGDVNGLKLTNDVFGHACGDILLQKIADIIKGALRKNDIAARWGGDEFIMLLPDTGRQQAREIIEGIKQSFAREKVEAIMGSISMGCAVRDNAGVKLSAVLDSAEQEMYRVKTLERENVESAAVKSIIDTLHSLNCEEKEHSDRISRISQNIGRAMNIPERDIRRLKDAGFLHDIGKIAIDNDISCIEGEMNAQQQKEYNRHTIIGYRILNSFDDTIDLAESVLSHHEKWDGTGYPKGLKGEEIPLTARIIAAAEFYEQITRVGKNRLLVSTADAKKTLAEQSGGRLDPAVVDVMLKLESRLLL